MADSLITMEVNELRSQARDHLLAMLDGFPDPMMIAWAPLYERLTADLESLRDGAAAEHPDDETAAVIDYLTRHVVRAQQHHHEMLGGFVTLAASLLGELAAHRGISPREVLIALTEPATGT